MALTGKPLTEFTFVIEAGRVDAQGDQIIIDGLQLPNKPVTVFKDFDWTQPVGVVEVFVEEGVLKGKGKLSTDVLSGYPSIGCQVLESTLQDGVRLIQSARLTTVGISTAPNADPHIPRLADQR